jgi:ATP-dependent RNA helicase DeaD
MKDFTTMGLSPALLKAIQELGFETPTPVQSKVIPIFLKSDRDLVALAQTGTGKTAAYGLPLLQLTDASKFETQGLILCPTRELCLQIVKDLNSFAKHTRGVRTLAVYGGSPIGEQIRALSRGAHIIVATPGRMHDMLRRQRADLSLVRWVVLDEADEMMNMGFQEEMEAILGAVPESARTLLFSATMPRQVAAMAGKYMENPEEILCGSRNSGSDTIHHECYKVHARDRYVALKRIMDSTPGLYAIIFCRTRVETQELAHHLNKDEYHADALHGDMTQDQRSEVMGAFRARHIQILVATDVAARGLDVNELTHVIHYNLPDEVELYTHRSGRTGRAGREGTSIVLIHYREEQKLRMIERILKKPFVQKRVPSGQEVCEAQLANLLEKVRQVDTADGRLEPFMPVIDKVLAELSREEVLKRFILLDFDRFLTNYKGAPDLNAAMSHGLHGGHEGGDRRGSRRPEGRMDRQDRSDRTDRAGRSDHPEREDRPAFRPRDPDVAKLRINLGRRNSLTPPDLMALINRATPGPQLRLGRIHVTEHASFFEMSRQDAERVMPALNRTTHAGREIQVVMETAQPPSGKRRREDLPRRDGG